MTWDELYDMKHKAQRPEVDLRFDLIHEQLNRGDHEVIEHTTFVWPVRADDRTQSDIEHGPLIIYLGSRNIIKNGEEVPIHDGIHVSFCFNSDFDLKLNFYLAKHHCRPARRCPAIRISMSRNLYSRCSYRR